MFLAAAKAEGVVIEIATDLDTDVLCDLACRVALSGEHSDETAALFDRLAFGDCIDPDEPLFAGAGEPFADWSVA